jgi:DNA-directed RNA polymerase specialized sigma24 family protein
MDVVVPKLKELWPRMCAHALRCVKDADKVKDIMQDTFEKLYSSRIDFNKVADIEAYIFRVLCNVIADTVKKLRLSQSATIDCTDLVPGTYMVKLYNDKHSGVKTFVKQ